MTIPNGSCQGYGADLAYIHDVGFGQFAEHAAPGLLQLLRKAGKRNGLVVDLGCGSGIWAKELTDAGYDVFGIDQSEPMIALARQRAPRGAFRAESFLTAELPPCVAVTAIGECFSYLFDRGNSERRLARLFHRIYRALEPNGLLIFDVIVEAPEAQRGFRAGEDWAVLVVSDVDKRRRLLTRRITSFRKVGDLYQRAEETHVLRLSDRSQLAAELRAAGFRVRTLTAYGGLPMLPGRVGFLARKRLP
jgi:SAM-dependent methyltransferase